MTENQHGQGYGQAGYQQGGYDQGYGQQGSAPVGQQQYGAMPGAPMGYAPASGPIGKQRSTGMCILLCIVTLGIYAWIWYYNTHEEMKRHTGEGLGGGIALVIAIFAGIISPFLCSGEVGKLYERRGQTPPPVSAMTGLWYFPGAFILVGPIVWFVKTNNALNEYWASLGAPRP